MKLNFVYVVKYTGNKIKKIDSLELGEKEKINILNSMKKHLEKSFHQKLPAFNVNMYFQPEPYSYTVLNEESDNLEEHAKTIHELVKQLQELLKNQKKEKAIVDGTTKYRTFLFNVEHEGNTYFVMNLIPGRKSIEHKKFIITKKNEMRYVELDYGLPLPEEPAAIFDSKKNIISVYKAEEFDKILADNAALKAQAEDKFGKLINGEIIVLDYQIKGISENYFNDLNIRHYKSLSAYSSITFKENITKENFIKAIQHESIPEEQRLQINGSQINIESKDQFKILISVMSERLLLDLLKDKIKTV